MFKLNKFIIGALLATAATSQFANASYKQEYKISIMNLTDGMIFTPFVLESSLRDYHYKSAFSLYKLGEPATDGLKDQARSGSTDKLKEELEANPEVCDVKMTTGLLKPGEKVEINLKTDYDCAFLSLSAMVLPSNDGFVAGTDIKFPFYKDKTVFLRAYDAGAEKNSGACVDKPGPQCQGTGTDDVDFKPDPLDFVRPLAPFTRAIAERATTLDLTDDDAVKASAKDAIILGQAEFANPIARVTIEVM